MRIEIEITTFVASDGEHRAAQTARGRVCLSNRLRTGVEQAVQGATPACFRKSNDVQGALLPEAYISILYDRDVLDSSM